MTDNSQSQYSGKVSHPSINLLRGWPNPSLLPVCLIRDEAATVLSDPRVFVSGLLYGPDAGDPLVRQHIAVWLTDFYKPAEAISPERIAVTGGASQSLGTLMQVYSDSRYTQNVWFVVPSYMLAFRIMEDAGFAGKLRSVPEDEEGIDIFYLEEELHKAEQTLDVSDNKQSRAKLKPQREYRKFYRHIIFTVPTFSNPSSKTISMQRREQLVRLARQFDALIICDDVYDFLQWSTDTTSSHTIVDKALVPRIVDVDRILDGGAERTGADGFGNVVSNGTFSKIVAPGIRTGWIEGSEKFAFGVSQAGTTVSGGAPSHTMSTVISSMLKSGDLHRFILEKLQPQYARRYYLLRAAIYKTLLPLGCRVAQNEGMVTGGFFVWLMLPQGVTGKEVAQIAVKEENLVVAAGSLFEVPDDNKKEGTNFDAYVRLCFAWEDEDNLSCGVSRLGRTIEKILTANAAVTEKTLC